MSWLLSRKNTVCNSSVLTTAFDHRNTCEKSHRVRNPHDPSLARTHAHKHTSTHARIKACDGHVYFIQTGRLSSIKYVVLQCEADLQKSLCVFLDMKYTQPYRTIVNGYVLWRTDPLHVCWYLHVSLFYRIYTLPGK